MCEHGLGVILGLSEGLSSEVAEHGVGVPATKEHDVRDKGATAEESGGATRAEAFTRQRRRFNAELVPQRGGCPPQGCGDVEGSDRSRTGRFHDGIDGRLCGGSLAPQVVSDAEQSFDRTISRVRVGPVGDLFSSDRVLLVSEGFPANTSKE